MITLKDVATAAGVSPSTVSRALTRPELLRPETVTTVRAAATRLGYVANPMARALTTGSSSILAVVATDLTNPFMTSFVKAAQLEAERHGLWLLMTDADERAPLAAARARELARLASGVLLVSPRLSDAGLRELAQEMPIVLVQRTVKGISSLTVDARPALDAALRHLAELGHQRVAHVPGPVGSWSGKRRTVALQSLAPRLGLDLAVLPPAPATMAAGASALAQVQEVGASAVTCFDDVMARGLVGECQRQGLSVPGDLSVVGHDDELADLGHPSLTTITGLAAELGDMAVHALSGAMAGTVASTELTSTLVVRESTGPMSTQERPAADRASTS